jgi:hypothetical protein
MSEQTLKALLPALDMAAFQRDRDGAFQALAPAPEWFVTMAHDTTFPFLGHILEEAAMFWQRGTAGSEEFGPCAEVDASGKEFHYKVLALTIGAAQYLVFQLDPGTDRMRVVLQKVRNEALSAERDAASYGAVVEDMRTTNQEIKHLLRSLVLSELTPEQREAVNSLAAKCVDQMGGVTRLINATIPHV